MLCASGHFAKTGRKRGINCLLIASATHDRYPITLLQSIYANILPQKFNSVKTFLQKSAKKVTFSQDSQSLALSGCNRPGGSASHYQILQNSLSAIPSSNVREAPGPPLQPPRELQAQYRLQEYVS